MTDEPWRATLDDVGVGVACRLPPKGGRDAIDGFASVQDELSCGYSCDGKAWGPGLGCCGGI